MVFASTPVASLRRFAARPGRSTQQTTEFFRSEDQQNRIYQRCLFLIHSPTLTLARAPTTVTSSRCPFTFTRSTANPVSSLWKATRSINPENPSWGGDDGGVFTLQSVSMGARPSHRRPRHFHQTVGGEDTLRNSLVRLD